MDAVLPWLTGPNRTTTAILLSNLLFTASHLHLSIPFAVAAFMPGLLWGAIYARQGTLVGASVSHALVAFVAFFVLKLEQLL